MADDRRLSKLLSYLLRHHPEEVGVTPDAGGWVAVADLLRGLTARGTSISRDDLERVVATNTKQRFALSADDARIRANQGHSIAVDLGYPSTPPPATLYHGTSERTLPSIRERGIERRARHHVHLSTTVESACAVGSRHGRAVVLRIDAERMHRDGRIFYVTPNGIWLTDDVPARYLTELA